MLDSNSIICEETTTNQPACINSLFSHLFTLTALENTKKKRDEYLVEIRSKQR